VTQRGQKIKITTLCDPLRSLWFNLPYLTGSLGSEKVHALANYQRAIMRQLLSAMRRCPDIKDPFISTGDHPILDHAHRTLPPGAKFNPALPPGFRITIDYLDLVPDIK